jgi:signal recognition particle GTPase
MGFLDKLKQGLQRTTQQFVDKFEDIVQRADAPEARTRDVDVDTAEALEEILLMADVGVAATNQIVTAVSKRARRGESLRDLVKQEILRILNGIPREPHSQILMVTKPKVILVVGVLVDTAGRLHTRTNLMSELDKIRRVAAKEVKGAPQEVLLVLDATVGQNGLAQAREFTSVAGVTGIVLTKLDGTAKGGIAVAIAHELKLPIVYVGVGEGVDDLLPFLPQDYVDAFFQEKW